MKKREERTMERNDEMKRNISIQSHKSQLQFKHFIHINKFICIKRANACIAIPSHLIYTGFFVSLLLPHRLLPCVPTFISICFIIFFLPFLLFRKSFRLFFSFFESTLFVLLLLRSLLLFLSLSCVVSLFVFFSLFIFCSMFRLYFPLRCDVYLRHLNISLDFGVFAASMYSIRMTLCLRVLVVCACIQFKRKKKQRRIISLKCMS